MKVAIMQPYIFPYIGYFQMINAVDFFVLYDDVNYIKGGWINRNKIVVNGSEKLFTIPLDGASSFKLINEIEINKTSKEYRKILVTIEQSYKKAPYFKDTFPLIENIFNSDNILISDFIANGMTMICKYLNIKTEIYTSSVKFAESKGLPKEERIVNICQTLGASTYINAIGGQELYSKNFFLKHGIDLKFIKSKPIDYNQFNDNFTPWLSIIDIIMFNSVDQINLMLYKYDLE